MSNLLKLGKVKPTPIKRTDPILGNLFYQSYSYNNKYTKKPCRNCNKGYASYSGTTHPTPNGDKTKVEIKSCSDNCFKYDMYLKELNKAFSKQLNKED